MTEQATKSLDYKGRVRKEKRELDIKVKALQSFIETNELFKSLPTYEQQDLFQQLQSMSHYQMILQKRINRF